MPVEQRIPRYLEEIRAKEGGPLALKFIRDWCDSRYRIVTITTTKIDGEEISYLSLRKNWCTEEKCEVYLLDLRAPSTVRAVVEVITSELKKRGEICVFLDDTRKMFRIEIDLRKGR